MNLLSDVKRRARMQGYSTGHFSQGTQYRSLCVTYTNLKVTQNLQID